MTPFDRQVRAQIFRLLLGGAGEVDAATISASRGWDHQEVGEALTRLSDEHRIALVGNTDRVRMAHPFSGIETEARTWIDDRSWFANCAWDALALMALLGEGHAQFRDLEWTVADGVVTPNHLIHLLVPARRFWEDVGFT